MTLDKNGLFESVSQSPLETRIPLDNRVLILRLCIDLLQSLRADAEREFGFLANEIVETAGCVNALQDGSNHEKYDFLAEKTSSLITRMQFSDLFCQRLDNAWQSLGSLHEILTENTETLSDSQWRSLLDETRDIFTSEKERQLFDRVFFALKQTTTHPIEHPSDDSVVLFD